MIKAGAMPASICLLRFQNIAPASVTSQLPGTSSPAHSYLSRSVPTCPQKHPPCQQRGLRICLQGSEHAQEQGKGRKESTQGYASCHLCFCMLPNDVAAQCTPSNDTACLLECRRVSISLWRPTCGWWRRPRSPRRHCNDASSEVARMIALYQCVGAPWGADARYSTFRPSGDVVQERMRTRKNEN